LTAISASPFEFSYQKAVPGGKSLKVDRAAASWGGYRERQRSLPER
jgi:hypothetical protein